MAIQQEGKPGRPIQWKKLWKAYNRKVDYWSRTYKTAPKDRIESIDTFEEKAKTVREKYGMNSVQVVRMLSQQAGLGVSLKQLNAYMAGAAKLGLRVDFKEAIKVFMTGVIRDVSDVKDKLADDFGDDWTIWNLKVAVANGTITLSEANTILRLHFGMDPKDRADWISQNVFGSD